MSVYNRVRNGFLILAAIGVILGFVQPLFWLVAGGLSMAMLAFITIGAFHIQLRIFTKALCFPSIKSNTVAITFDDGPGFRTPLVLDMLKKYQAKATFFCIGKNIEAHPELLVRMAREGHEIGNHTYSHSYFLPFFSRQKLMDELTKTQVLLDRSQKSQNKLFRPPFGVTNPTIAAAAAKAGYTVVGWNLRSLDSLGRDPDHLVTRITKKIRPGTVLLLHDNLENSARILEGILQFVHQQEWRCTTVSEIFDL